MFAIVEIAGQQFKVEKGRSYFVHRLAEEVGSSVSFNKVLLLHNGVDIQVGVPLVDGISIEAKVVEHLKGDKIVVFKKKRRKGYRVKNGHRQCFTKIMVENIGVGESSKKKTSVKKDSVVETNTAEQV